MTSTRLLLISLSAICVAAVARADDTAKRTISVTGEGEVKAVPDLAIVAFAVETSAPTAAEAVASNARKSTTLADALRKVVGPQDKVSTTRYSLDPRYETRDRTVDPTKIIGYIAHNEVRVELNDVEKVGTAIDAATKAGANRVNGLQFTLRDQGPQIRAALQRAGEAARLQAESVAQALGVRLGQVLTANTSTSPIMPRPVARFAMAAEVSRASTPVEPGEVTVNATLQVTYAIE
jgi:uncharacterized protein